MHLGVRRFSLLMDGFISGAAAWGSGSPTQPGERGGGGGHSGAQPQASDAWAAAGVPGPDASGRGCEFGRRARGLEPRQPIDEA